MSHESPGRGARLALFMSSLSGGGVQRSMGNLAVALAEAGHELDLVVCHDGAAGRAPEFPEGVRVIRLARSLPGHGRLLALRADAAAWRLLLRPILLPVKISSKLRYLPALTRYLRQQRPAALLSAEPHCNLVALWAQRLAGGPTRVVVSERNMLSSFVAKFRGRWRWRYLPPLVGHAYGRAHAVVAVSEAVANDLARITGLPRAGITPIPNPVVSRQLQELAAKPVDHAWFTEAAPPVVICVSRLVPQKDIATLLQAFGLLRASRPAHLLILGEGPERATLEQRIRDLGIADDVSLAGWVENPYPYMARAGVLVLPSLFEGLPGVLVQAMACGCPVVATDCPGGSSEVLGHGSYGRLVPVGDPEAMARAIAAQLDAIPDRDRLRRRAAEYSSERAAARYLAVMLPPR
jgi:glycosyltransferase involved in cell wall biosynthesis